MQRCPYIHEMKERLLSSQGSNPEQQLLEGMDKDVLEIHGDPTVGTVVKVWPLLYNILHYNICHSVILLKITVNVIMLHILFSVYKCFFSALFIFTSHYNSSHSEVCLNAIVYITAFILIYIII